MDLKEHIYLNQAGWWWPKHDTPGQGGAWFDLAGPFAETPKKMAGYVPQKRVVVQAGGNGGLYPKSFSQLFDLVYTFEADPINFACLSLNVTESNVFKFHAALGFHRQGISTANDMFPGNMGAKYVGGTGPIPTLRIDDLGLEVCDLIQLDIEGFELHALHGAQETITRCHPVLALEFGWEGRYGISRQDIDLFLNAVNYKLVEALPNGQGDFIYKYAG